MKNVPFDNPTIQKENFLCREKKNISPGHDRILPVNQVNHTSWVAVVTPTDRPKSVRNRCVIKLFCGVVCVVTLLF